MKKKMMVFFAVLLMLAVTGCAKNEEITEEVTAESVQESVIMPLPTTVDMDNLNDCMLAVSLDEEDAFLNEDGNAQMKVKVWTYDLYDMVDTSMLAEGSVIQIRGKDVEVSSVEVTGNKVLINGGLDNGGYELRTDEGTVYYEIGYSDQLSYYEVGESVFPVAEEFVFIDAADLDKGEISYSFEELQNNKEITFDFRANNTKLVIEEGKITVMERVYTP